MLTCSSLHVVVKHPKVPERPVKPPEGKFRVALCTHAEVNPVVDVVADLILEQGVEELSVKSAILHQDSDVFLVCNLLVRHAHCFGNLGVVCVFRPDPGALVHV